LVCLKKSFQGKQKDFEKQNQQVSSPKLLNQESKNKIVQPLVSRFHRNPHKTTKARTVLSLVFYTEGVPRGLRFL